MLPRRLSQISSIYGWKVRKRNSTLHKQEHTKVKIQTDETQTRQGSQLQSHSISYLPFSISVQLSLMDSSYHDHFIVIYTTRWHIPRRQVLVCPVCHSIPTAQHGSLQVADTSLNDQNQVNGCMTCAVPQGSHSEEHKA